MDATATTGQLKWLDSKEWMLFSHLVMIDLQQDNPVAWQIVTLWVWISEHGIPDLTMKLLKASNAVLHFLSKETMVCLECIKTGRITENPLNDLPFLQPLTNNTISLQFFLTKRKQVLEGMLRVTDNICARRFSDIEWQSVAYSILPAMSEIRTIATNLAAHEAMTQMLSRSMTRPFGEGSSRGTGVGERQTKHFNEDITMAFDSTKPVQFRPFGDDAEGFMIRPSGEGSNRGIGFRERQPRPSSEEIKRAFDPSPIATFGERQICQAQWPLFTESDLCNMTRNLNIRDREERSCKLIFPKEGEENRSLFVTFSHGYPVTLREVRNFLTKSYGNCIESVNMQDVVPPRVQALFAVVVLKEASSVERILNGRPSVNFHINGKHARVRRWHPKRST